MLNARALCIVGADTEKTSTEDKDLKTRGIISELKVEVKKLEAEVTYLAAELHAEKASKKFEVEKKELEVKLSMQEKIDDAYNLGWKRCQESFELLAKLGKLQ